MRHTIWIGIALTLIAPRSSKGVGDRDQFSRFVECTDRYEQSVWTGNFWFDCTDVCRTSTVPSMGKLMDGTDRSQFWQNFRIAAGEVAGRHRGPPWNDGDSYKWLEAVASLYAANRDPALDKQMDEYIRLIAKSQRADGYLHTPVLIRERNGEPLSLIHISEPTRPY